MIICTVFFIWYKCKQTYFFAVNLNKGVKAVCSCVPRAVKLTIPGDYQASVIVSEPLQQICLHLAPVLPDNWMDDDPLKSVEGRT